MVHVSDESKALADDILSSARARRETMRELKSWVTDFLARCDEEQFAVAESLRRAAAAQRARTADAEAARLEAFVQLRAAHDEVRAQITRDIATLVAQTRRFLHDCDDWQYALGEEVHDAARELRQQLADGDEARLAVFDGTYDRVAKHVTALRQQVRQQLAACGRDFLATHAIWRHLGAACARLRDGVGHN
jgi:hypothetical protein